MNVEFGLTSKYAGKFAPEIPILPQGKFVSIFLIRETMSHAIFTTEGDILDTERVQSTTNSQKIRKSNSKTGIFRSEIF